MCIYIHSSSWTNLHASSFDTIVVSIPNSIVLIKAIPGLLVGCSPRVYIEALQSHFNTTEFSFRIFRPTGGAGVRLHSPHRNGGWITLETMIVYFSGRPLGKPPLLCDSLRLAVVMERQHWFYYWLWNAYSRCFRSQSVDEIFKRLPRRLLACCELWLRLWRITKLFSCFSDSICHPR